MRHPALLQFPSSSIMLSGMSATIAVPIGRPGSATSLLDGIAVDYTERFLEICEAVKTWHREKFLAAEPAREDINALGQTLPWLIRAARSIHAQMLDPQWPHPQQARRLEAALWQLEEIWASENNPLNTAEADTLLKIAFPE